MSIETRTFNWIMSKSAHPLFIIVIALPIILFLIPTLISAKDTGLVIAGLALLVTAAWWAFSLLSGSKIKPSF
jgi:hypothetical protein